MGNGLRDVGYMYSSLVSPELVVGPTSNFLLLKAWCEGAMVSS